MARTMTYSETLAVTHCWCGIALAIPENLLRHAHNDGQVVYCPLGHQFSWSETEAKRLKKRLEQEERRASSLMAQLDQEKASHRSTKGQLTKAKKRAAKGVCPVPGCKRSFVNVARHVETQHPDFEHAEHTS